jgi:hypothetical protein
VQESCGRSDAGTWSLHTAPHSPPHQPAHPTVSQELDQTTSRNIQVLTAGIFLCHAYTLEYASIEFQELAFENAPSMISTMSEMEVALLLNLWPSTGCHMPVTWVTTPDSLRDMTDMTKFSAATNTPTLLSYWENVAEVMHRVIHWEPLEANQSCTVHCHLPSLPPPSRHPPSSLPCLAPLPPADRPCAALARSVPRCAALYNVVRLHCIVPPVCIVPRLRRKWLG